MPEGVFITGTDTNVGKTVAAAALLLRYRDLGTARYWKPIQTGIEEDDDTRTVRILASSREGDLFDDGVRLPRPLAPSQSAALRGERIRLEDLTARIEGQPAADRWIVEGAGGLHAPVNERDLMSDFMVRLSMPVLVVARSGLGTINHTLLTLEALRSRRLRIAGVLMVGPPNEPNRRDIERFGAVSVIAEMPHFAQLTRDTLIAWTDSSFDRGGHLEELFR